jgi:hypothetical protein
MAIQPSVEKDLPLIANPSTVGEDALLPVRGLALEAATEKNRTHAQTYGWTKGPGIGSANNWESQTVWLHIFA